MNFDTKLGALGERHCSFILVTSVPKDEITDAMLIKRVRQTGLKVGDEFIVQCMSDDYDYGDGVGTLLHEGRFEVSRHYQVPAVDDMNEHSPRQYMKQDYSIWQIGDWRATPHAKAVAKARLQAGEAA